MQHDYAPTNRQIEILITIERTGAGCSMVAIVLILLSFCLFKKLRTTPNLFLVFASIANAGASIASMIGYDGLHKGQGSDLCQAQAFIFEWFMQSDPWWSFAMSVNVFLVFFCNFNPSTFKRYAWLYCVVCFGGPLIPAIILISIHNHPQGPVFGDAALWCWISTDWSLIRLYSYYIPIWVCIFLSIVIYVAVGYHVFHHRNQLRGLAVDPGDKQPDDGCSPGSSQNRESIEESFIPRTEFYGTAITEVQITSDVSKQKSRAGTTIPGAVHCGISPQRHRSWAIGLGDYENEAYFDHKNQRFETVCSSDNKPRPPLTVFTRLRAVKSNASLKLKRLDPIKMAYLRTSFIFGFAVLITWIPSSINRLYSLTHDDRISFSLSVASGCVLPLQGVWNAIIYFTTSWKAFAEEMESFKAKWARNNHDDPDAMRLESRIGGVKVEERHTFERTRRSDATLTRPETAYGDEDTSLGSRVV